MHAVLITFHATAQFGSLYHPFAGYARQLVAVPGLVATTWLRDGAIFGGFHLFASRRAADEYLDSALAANLTADPAFSDFAILQYDVIADPDRLTGLPGSASD